MNYELVFDVSEAGYRNWWFPAGGLIIVAIGVGKQLCQHKDDHTIQSRWTRWSPYLFIAFAILWVAAAFVATFSEYWRLRQALRSKSFEIVEGRVIDFVPMPKGGHRMEKFTVNGHHYEYSDYYISAAFNQTQSHGGPIHDGLFVRIADVEGKIARLEIAR